MRKFLKHRRRGVSVSNSKSRGNLMKAAWLEKGKKQTILCIGLSRQEDGCTVVTDCSSKTIRVDSGHFMELGQTESLLLRSCRKVDEILHNGTVYHKVRSHFVDGVCKTRVFLRYI